MKSPLSLVPRSRPRGAVLLLVLGAIAILSILAVELAHRANLASANATRTARDASFRRVFNAGMEVSKGLIIEGRPSSSQGYDTASDPWAKPVKIDTGDREHLTVQLFDESAKLNILKAIGTTDEAVRYRKSLARLLAYLRKTDDGNAQHWDAIELALKTRLGIDNGVATPDVLYTLDGLREAGIGKDLLFGSTSDANVDQKPLSAYLTTWGDGRVNLNTATAPVLYALDDEYNDDLIAQIESWRGNLTAPTDTITAFKTTKELELVPGIIQRATVDGHTQIVRDLYTIVQDRVAVKSACISARIIAEINGERRMAFGYFEVTPLTGSAQQLRLLAFEEVEP